MATKYLTELAPKGVTATMITDLDTLIGAMDDAIDDLDTANRDRNVATQERVDMANDLYANIVELFDFGKDHWYTRSEAKYNDYIIYNVAGGGATPPATVIEGTVAANTTEVVVSELDENAEVTINNTGTVPFIICGSDNDTPDPCAEGETLNPSDEVIYEGGSSSTGPLPAYLKITNADPTTEAAYQISIS